MTFAWTNKNNVRMKHQLNHKSKLSTLSSRILVSLVVAQLVVVLGSWVWSAALPESSVRSLLGSGGIRWFFGTFVDNLARPLLVWVVLADIGAGMVKRSGLWQGVWSFGSLDPQQSSGLRATAVLLVAEVAVMLLLTLPPHAVLLSVTGELFPSSFSASIVPVLAFMMVTFSICYGLFSGTFHNYGDIAKCACNGGAGLKTLLVIYVLAVELYCSIVYVAG